MVVSGNALGAILLYTLRNFPENSNIGEYENMDLTKRSASTYSTENASLFEEDSELLRQGNCDVVIGDVRQVLKAMAEDTFQCCVTSPPYWGLRDYGVGGQIGAELDVQDYIKDLVDVFKDVKRVLRPDGVLWVNLGDSYTSGGRTWRDKDSKNQGRAMSYRADTPLGLKPKDLIGVPWRLALGLQGLAVIPSVSLMQWADWLAEAREKGDWEAVTMVEKRLRASALIDALKEEGWYLRTDIVWNKPNCQPESVKDRPTRSHEYIFLLSKSKKYYYDPTSIMEPAVDAKNGPKNRRTVWNINTEPYSGAHFAVYPRQLVRMCVNAGSKPGDKVLDPFFGSGTTGVVCNELGRDCTGIELNAEFAELARTRLNKGR